MGAILGAVGSVIGGVVSAAGAQQQAQAQAQQAQYEAAVARNNATAEAYSAAEKSQNIALQGQRTLAQQRAAYGASGAQVATGSPVTVFGASSGRLQGDVAAAQYAGAINSQRWQDQAQLNELKASNALKAGQVASMGAIIGGITGVGKMFSGGTGSALTAFG